jgi:hypothetical protein
MIKSWLKEELRHFKKGPQPLRGTEDATASFQGKRDSPLGCGKRIEIDVNCGEIYPLKDIGTLIAKEFPDVPKEYINIGIWRRGGGWFREPYYRIVLQAVWA